MFGNSKLYGVGVGPGDPELLTLKALRVLHACNYWAHPGKNKENSVALKTAMEAVENWKEKEILDCPVPMTKDAKSLEEAYDRIADEVVLVLQKGEDVAFINLGDPTIFGSFCELSRKVEAKGFQTEIISGIPSFCAAAASVGHPLCERDGELHLIPASYDVVEALKLPGTKVFMKAGKQLSELLTVMTKLGKEGILVENASRGNEQICNVPGDDSMEYGYLTLVIVEDS